MQKLLFVILLWTVMVLPAYAFNMGFLEYSPAYYFSKEDWKIMEAVAKKALDSGAPDVKVSWRNPGSTASGYVIPSSPFQSDGVTCRNLTIFQTARQITDEVHYRFCKFKGEWKVF